MSFSIGNIARFDTQSWDIFDHRYDIINLSLLNDLPQEDTDTDNVKNIFKAVPSVLLASNPIE